MVGRGNQCGPDGNISGSAISTSAGSTMRWRTARQSLKRARPRGASAAEPAWVRVDVIGGDPSTTQAAPPQTTRRRAWPYQGSAPVGRKHWRHCEGGGETVLRREKRLLHGQGNGEVRVVPGDAALGFGRVVLGALVEEVRRLAEHAEAVSEAGRDPELERARVRQLEGDPLPEAGRATPDVHRDVVHGAAENLDQLPLSTGLLEVQPAQDAAGGTREVVLEEGPRDAGLRVPPCLEALVEESPAVTVQIGLDQQHLGKLRRRDLHPMAPRFWRRSRRYLP